MKYIAIDPALPPVSAISLGSWNTFSRLLFEDLVALLRRSLDLGVNFFDVGYYWDKPHTEVIFGRAMQVIGAPRDSYLLAEKLWLWDYPQQSFADQLKAALVRLDAAYVDLVMVSRPLPDMDFDAFCEEVVDLIDAGLARAWGLTNWDPEQIRRAQALMAAKGRPSPKLIQAQYNVCRTGVVETPEFDRLFAETDIRLSAAFTLEGGILAGHLDRDRVQPSEFALGKTPVGRNIARDSGGVRDAVRDRQALLVKIAKDLSVTPAQAAIGYCLGHPGLGSTLIGVTRIADLEEDIGALAMIDHADEIRAALAPLAVDGVRNPKLFNPHNDE